MCPANSLCCFTRSDLLIPWWSLNFSAKSLVSILSTLKPDEVLEEPGLQYSFPMELYRTATPLELCTSSIAFPSERNPELRFQERDNFVSDKKVLLKGISSCLVLRVGVAYDHLHPPMHCCFISSQLLCNKLVVLLICHSLTCPVDLVESDLPFLLKVAILGRRLILA